MFESLELWCKTPFTLYPYAGQSGSGDIITATPVQLKCYKAEENKLIVDASGNDFVSTTQLYIPAGLQNVTALDNISFEDDKKLRVHKVGGFIDGETGKMDMQVIYL